MHFAYFYWEKCKNCSESILFSKPLCCRDCHGSGGAFDVFAPLMCLKLLTKNALVHLVLIEGLSPIPHPLKSGVEVGGVHGNANDFTDTKN